MLYLVSIRTVLYNKNSIVLVEVKGNFRSEVGKNLVNTIIYHMKATKVKGEAWYIQYRMHAYSALICGVVIDCSVYMNLIVFGSGHRS